MNTIEKQSIINLRSYSSKSYISIVLGDPEVNFLQEGMDATCGQKIHTDILELRVWSSSVCWHTESQKQGRVASYWRVQCIVGKWVEIKSHLLVIQRTGIDDRLGKWNEEKVWEKKGKQEEKRVKNHKQHEKTRGKQQGRQKECLYTELSIISHLAISDIPSC